MPILKILHTVNLISVSVLIVLISGCATGSKDSILPQQGPTMKQVYEGHFIRKRGYQNNSEGNEDLVEVVPNDPINTESKLTHSRLGSKTQSQLIARHHNFENENDLAGYTRHAHNEIQQLFPRLKNRTLTLYIFPHLSKAERHPVPGYSTTFMMYKQTEYALPGELEESY